MPFPTRALLVLVLADCAGPGASPPDRFAGEQEAVAAGRLMADSARLAWRAGNHEAYARYLDRADSLRPNHPAILYNRASAAALLGHADEALARLELLVQRGLSAHPDRDTDFNSLTGDPRFSAVAARLEANGAPQGRPSIAVTLPASERAMLAEGVARDPASGDLFVGGVRSRRILRIHGSRVTPFAPDSARGSVFGMAVDPRRRLLWAATATLPHTGVDSAARGRSALLAYDLEDGSLQYRFEPEEPGPHGFNDLAVAPSGDVYVTDHGTPMVYQVLRDGDRLEPLMPDGWLGSPEGIVVSEDGNALYLADYTRGIVRIGLADHAATLLAAPEDLVLLGVDGLARHGGALVAIQNGTSPARILRLEVDDPGRRITGWSVLAAAQPAWDEPTLGVIAGDTLFYVANSQWGSFDQAGQPAPGAGLRPPVIERLRLD